MGLHWTRLPCRRLPAAQPAQAPTAPSSKPAAWGHQSPAKTTGLVGTALSKVIQAPGTALQRLNMPTAGSMVWEVDLVEGTTAWEYCSTPAKQNLGDCCLNSSQCAVPLAVSWAGGGGEETPLSVGTAVRCSPVPRRRECSHCQNAPPWSHAEKFSVWLDVNAKERDFISWQV